MLCHWHDERLAHRMHGRQKSKEPSSQELQTKELQESEKTKKPVKGSRRIV